MADLINSVANDGRVAFYPWRSDDTSGGAAMDTTYRVNVDEDLIDVKTSKPKGSAGSFDITLGSRVNYKRILQPGCWVTIHMSDQPMPETPDSSVDGGLKMIGIVRSVRRVESLDPNTRTRTVRYVVSGQDYQSALENPIYINANLVSTGGGQDSTQIGGFVLYGDLMGNLQSPATIVQGIINTLLGTPAYAASGALGGKIAETGAPIGGQPFRVPPTVAKAILGETTPNNLLTEMLTLFLQNNLVGKILLQPDIGNQVSAWSMAETYSHDMLNEFYTDLLPVDTGNGVKLTPSIILRAIPFSTERSDNTDASCILLTDAGSPQVVTRSGNTAVFPVASQDDDTPPVPPGTGSHFYISRNIADGEILSFNSGRSDRERFNFFFCPPNYATDNGELLLLEDLLSSPENGGQGGDFSSLADVGSIQRYGSRPYVRFSDFSNNEDDDIYTINNIVKDMWKDAHLYDSGIVTVNGTRYHIPVGTNVWLTDRNMGAHVEQVDHSYSVTTDGQGNKIKTFRTTVAFVRLFRNVNGKAEPTDLIGDDDDGQLGDWDRGVSS
jgi:hypothetical protein